MRLIKCLFVSLLAVLLLSACGAQKTQETTKSTQPAAAAPEITQPAPTESGNEDIYLEGEMRICSFQAQYIRTDGYHDNIKYPVVKVIQSPEELQAYYEENRSLYDLERRADYGTDYTPGFLDACDKYDAAYFENQFLLMVLIQEGSGSVTHEVTGMSQQEADGQLLVGIRTISPEVGTADMALWHILIEPEAGIKVPNESQIEIYVDEKLAYNGHSHILAETPETVDDPTTGYCGNTVTTIKFLGEEYSFWGDHSVTLTDILINLNYNPHKVCKCLPEFTIVTEFGSYGVHLSQGYARCQDGQAALTREQVWQIRTIIEAETQKALVKTEEEIATIAMKHCTISYDTMNIHLDTVKDYWVVHFYTENMAGGDQTVTIDIHGNVISNFYGE